MACRSQETKSPVPPFNHAQSAPFNGMLSGSSTTGQQPAVANTITVRNLVTSLNPLKRVKLKENQTLVTARGPMPEELAVKRKLPLGNYVSAANIMPVGARAAEVQFLLREKIFGSVGAPPAVDSSGAGGGGKGRKRHSGGPEQKGGGSAVERRNARERNRVQQVNNGFAALRQRIPDEIAEAFEAGTTARGVHKKLSKVETLRMAVEYIKSLERLLECTGGPAEPGTRHRFADEALPGDSQLPATPPPEPVGGHPTNFFLAIKPRGIGKPTGAASQGLPTVTGDGVGAGVEGSAVAGFDQTQITIINGHQYMRIPGTNTFQYLDPERLYDEDLESSAGLDFSEDSGTRGPLLLDEEDEDEDDTASSSADLLSESALALSPQSNFTPDSEGKREVDSFYHPLPMACAPQLTSCQQQQQQLQQLEQTSLQTPAGEELGFDQQQYDDLMLIKSELEDDTNLTEDPAFISWIETSQQLQMQQQLQQQLQQHQSILD
uniref:Uncharacterized protein n=1 Tax=Anopheles atroparvus TaxID=41427 RepID=A0A182IKC7_ANOAO